MSVNYDLYNYVAANNPDEAKAVLNKYGYDASTVETVEVLGSGLANMVDENGENALRDVLKIHPDRDAILQETSVAAAPQSSAAKPCGCGGCKGNSTVKAIDAYLDKIKPAAPVQDNSISPGNQFLLIGGIIILAVAIIVKN